MGEDVELWGTFSVNDHMRRRAFVAEVLLYDRLVIPVPPPDDEEYDRWRDNRWQPGRQRRLVEILGEADCLVEIPAVKLASRSEFRERRADFHSWRRQISAAEGGREKAVRELERRLERYQSAARAKRVRGRVLTTMTVFGLAAEATALVFPPAAIPGTGLLVGASTLRRRRSGPSRSPIDGPAWRRCVTTRAAISVAAGGSTETRTRRPIGETGRSNVDRKGRLRMARETKKTETKARKAPARKPATTRARRRAVTHDDIAFRAYELHLAGGLDPFANWVSAERELRAV